jgi:uncharacterized protein YlxW (UPF0749 family)
MDVPAVPKTALGRAVVWVSTFAKAHEFLLIAALAAFVLLGITGKVQDVIAAHDQRVYDAAQAARQAQTAANAELAKQAAQRADDYKQVVQQVLDANRKLEDDNRRLLSELAKRQADDAKLPPPQLAARIETLANIPTGSITPQPGETFSVTQPGVVGIAQTLEKVPALEGQLSNANAEKANTEKQLASQSALVTALNVQVTGLQSEIKKADTECKAEVKSVKADAAKGKRKWFVAGYVAGFASAVAVKIFGGK